MIFLILAASVAGMFAVIAGVAWRIEHRALAMPPLKFHVELFREKEEDCWIALVPELPGVASHGKTKAAAIRQAAAMAFLVLAEKARD
jgi:predicted RNase H-like HicB family nuclease